MPRVILIALLLGCLSWPHAAPAGQLKILTEDNPPLSFEKNGRPGGFSVEVVREILTRLGCRAPIRVTPWARGLQMLDTQPNVALFSTARTPDRESRYRWVGPLCIMHWGFFARADSPLRVESLDDARKVRAIATYHNDAKERYLKLRGFTNLESANSPRNNLKKLLSGRVDLWLHPIIGAPLIARQLGIDPGRLRMVLPVASVDLYIAFSRDTPPAEIQRWRNALNGIKKDGTFTAIAARWLPVENYPSDICPQNTALTIYTENLPPVNYVENGKLKGFAVDVVRGIQRRLKRTDPIYTVPWARGYHLALTRPDSALFSTTRLAQREALFKWVGPLYRQQWEFYARKGSGIQIYSMEEARNIGRIGTYRNDAKEQALQSLGFRNLVSSNNNISNVKHLMRGNIDLWVSSDFNMRYIAHQAGVDPDGIVLVYPFHQVENYIAFSRQTPDEVVTAWQQALDDMKKDGSYTRLRNKWRLPVVKSNP